MTPKMTCHETMTAESFDRLAATNKKTMSEPSPSQKEGLKPVKRGASEHDLRTPRGQSSEQERYQ